MTTSEQRAEQRRSAYPEHIHDGVPDGKAIVPEPLRELDEFVELEQERMQLRAAASRIREERAAWEARIRQARELQAARTGSRMYLAKSAIESGDPLPDLTPDHVIPFDPQWPFQALHDIPWGAYELALDGEIRARVLAHGQEPLR